MQLVTQTFPLNCVFLEFSDGIFITKESAYQMLDGYSSISSSSSTVSSGVGVGVGGNGNDGNADDNNNGDGGDKADVNNNNNKQSSALNGDVDSDSNNSNNSNSNKDKIFAVKVNKNMGTNSDGSSASSSGASSSSSSSYDSIHLKPIPDLDKVNHFVKLSQLESTIQKLVGIQDGIDTEQQKCLQLKRTIETTIQSRERIRILKQAILDKKCKIEKLERIHEQSFAAIQRKRKQQLVKSQYIMNHLDQLTSSCHALNQYSATLMQHESASIPKLRSQLDIIENRCSRRQTQIANLVAQCFEVTRDKTNKYWMINGLVITKNDLVLNTDDEAASALGFVCQCTRILSKLYQIPLKYQVFPMASRSFVHDKQLLLPLFMMRASERQKYIQAVDLLNRNLCQLLEGRNLQASPNRLDVLENLAILLNHTKSMQ